MDLTKGLLARAKANRKANKYVTPNPYKVAKNIADKAAKALRAAKAALSEAKRAKAQAKAAASSTNKVRRDNHRIAAYKRQLRNPKTSLARKKSLRKLIKKISTFRRVNKRTAAAQKKLAEELVKKAAASAVLARADRKVADLERRASASPKVRRQLSRQISKAKRQQRSARR